MPSGDLNHLWHETSRVGKANDLWQLQQGANSPLLFGHLQLAEWPREMPTRAQNGGSAGAVVPVGGGVKLHAWSTDANEKLLDEETIVENDVHY